MEVWSYTPHTPWWTYILHVLISPRLLYGPRKYFMQMPQTRKRRAQLMWDQFSLRNNSHCPPFSRGTKQKQVSIHWVRSFSFPGSTPVCDGFFFPGRMWVIICTRSSWKKNNHHTHRVRPGETKRTHPVNGILLIFVSYFISCFIKIGPR